VQVSGQMPGHQRKVGSEWVVQMEGKDYPVVVTPIPGGYSVTHGADRYDLVSDWKFGELVFRGTCNGTPICLQLERIGLLYRVVHFGKQVKVTVMTANAARMLALMPKKVPPDLSKFLLSPMPGLLREVSVTAGQAGQRRRKTRGHRGDEDGKRPQGRTRLQGQEGRRLAGESLSVDQVIIEFE
jgi:propionyl-CoA carboxylase alpha chain